MGRFAGDACRGGHGNRCVPSHWHSAGAGAAVVHAGGRPVLMDTDPETFGKMAVAINPKASPNKAPTISEGEKMPPPMRPAMVIATATTFMMQKTMVMMIKTSRTREPFSDT